MPKVADHNEIRENLMYAAVKVVAELGLENTTTKEIARASGYNEAYIYRYFLDRDDLLLKAFLNSDQNMMNELAAHLYLLYDTSKSFKDRLFEYFEKIWEYETRDWRYATFYFRFYYSKMFVNSAFSIHTANAQTFFMNIKRFVKEDVNADLVIHFLYMNSSSIPLLMGEEMIQNSEENKYKVFNAIYLMLKPILKEDEEIDKVLTY